MKTFLGEVVAEIVEVRFAFSGKIARVNKAVGDTIAVGTVIASLDRKAIQAELDRQLADYERVRAKFEISKIEITNTSDVNKFLAQASQAELNASVKDVELAKYRLDNADLISPVTGVIIGLGGLRAGLNVTPGANAVSIVDTASYKFKFPVGQKDLSLFQNETAVKIEIAGVTGKIETKTAKPLLGKNGHFDILAPVSHPNLLPGLQGKLSV